MFQLSAQSNGKPSTNVKVILGPSCSFRNPDINRPVKYILFYHNLFGAFQNMTVTQHISIYAREMQLLLQTVWKSVTVMFWNAPKRLW